MIKSMCTSKEAFIDEYMLPLFDNKSKDDILPLVITTLQTLHERNE